MHSCVQARRPCAQWLGLHRVTQMQQRLSKDGAGGATPLTRQRLENINNPHSKWLFISECSEASVEKNLTFLWRAGCPVTKVRVIKSASLCSVFREGFGWYWVVKVLIHWLEFGFERNLLLYLSHARADMPTPSLCCVYLFFTEGISLENIQIQSVLPQLTHHCCDIELQLTLFSINTWQPSCQDNIFIANLVKIKIRQTSSKIVCGFCNASAKSASLFANVWSRFCTCIVKQFVLGFYYLQMRRARFANTNEKKKKKTRIRWHLLCHVTLQRSFMFLPGKR